MISKFDTTLEKDYEIPTRKAKVKLDPDRPPTQCHSHTPLLLALLPAWHPLDLDLALLLLLSLDLLGIDALAFEDVPVLERDRRERTLERLASEQDPRDHGPGENNAHRDWSVVESLGVDGVEGGEAEGDSEEAGPEGGD